MNVTNEPRKHVKMPDEPLEIDEEDFYVRAFIKWAIEEQPEVKRLEAENEMLRKELAVTNPLFETLNVANDRLIYENMKLRELVRKVEHYEQYGCYECPYADSCDVGTLYDVDCAMSREIERKKHELGIEVDV